VSVRTSRIETSKPKTLKFHLENLADLVLGHDPWSHGARGNRGKGIWPECIVELSKAHKIHGNRTFS
jgi:hypothetical protein